MKIVFYPERCQGHGRCYSLASELFDADDLGHCVVLQTDVPPELEQAARNGADNCPEQALVIED